MIETHQTSRTARHASYLTWPNVAVPCSALLRTPCRPPELPADAAYVGSVRVPLTLHVAPRARLYRHAHGELHWHLRLPTAEGSGAWRRLPGEEIVAWALASRLPGLAREARALLALASTGRAGAPRLEAA